MKTLAYLIIMVILSITAVGAQVDEQEQSGTYLAYNFNGDVQESGRSYTSFSITDADDSYKVRSKFNKSKTPRIQNYLREKLGKKNLKISGSKYHWEVFYDDDEVYEVTLDEGSLKIFVNKETASGNTLRNFKEITQNIKNYTSGKSDKDRVTEQIERERERVEREAERNLREAERLKREADRLKKEAERLEREAKLKRGDTTGVKGR